MTEHAESYNAAVARLRAEGHQLESVLQNATWDDWRRATPAAGWTISHQIAHLAWTDRLTLCTLRSADAFQAYAATAADDPLAAVNEAAEVGSRRAPQELFSDWAAGRRVLADALESADRENRYPWFGPPMKARSLITARIMETWAHGQDVAQALNRNWEPSTALKDIAHLGYATRTFTYINNGLTAPTSDVHVRLEGPAGETWSWGDAHAKNQIAGTAWEFALLVTQRAEVEDLHLQITGEEAYRWATIAQAFAGPPKSVVRSRNGETYTID